MQLRQISRLTTVGCDEGFSIDYWILSSSIRYLQELHERRQKIVIHEEGATKVVTSSVSRLHSHYFRKTRKLAKILGAVLEEGSTS